MILGVVAVVGALAMAAPPPDAEPNRTEIHPGPADPPPTAVIGPDRLAPAPDLPAALDGEVGLRVTRLGGLGSFATLSIRGSTPEQVLVVLDGIPLNPADGAPVDLASLPLGPLGAVAIYRGRAPYAFGVDAIGGVLALKSRSVARPALDVSLGLGSFDTRLVRGWASAGRVGVALDYSGSAGDFRFLNDQGTAWTRADDQVERRRNGDFDQGSVLVKGGLELGHARVVLLDLFTAADRGLPGLGVQPTRASRFSLLRNLGGARLDAHLGRLRLGALAYLGWSRSAVDDPLGEIGLGSGHSALSSVVPGATVELAIPLSGADWHLTPSSVTAWRFESTSGTSVADAQRSVLSTALELAFRHDVGVEARASARLELLPELAPAARFEIATSALADIRIGLSASLSHRLPSLFELHGDTGTTLGAPDLRPETARSVELDARWDPGPDAWLEAFAYASDVDDLIQVVQNAQGVVRPANLASARILGAELAGGAILADEHLVVRGGLGLLDAVDTSGIAARDGKRLPLRPAVTASARVELRFGDDSARIGIWTEADHISGNSLDFADLVRLPARTLLGAGVYVERGTLRIEASLANLLDQRSVDLAGYPLPGTTALVMLRMHPDI
ncbi:MAG: TonB-dependent receptor [Myxococcota bacterium]